MNLTARIAGDQILCTEPIARATPGIAGLDARALGEERFKNVLYTVPLIALAPNAKR